MPFPLAHPAAVLPLRRYCPRWLNFPALVIGSMVPDVAYLFVDRNLSTISHQVLGSIGFGLPIGVLLLAVLYRFRTDAIKMMPETQKRTFIALGQRPLGPIWLAIVSLIIGILSHVFWDSFTHNDGWLVEHLPILQMPLVHFEERTARVCHVLWYASSFAGVGWLFIEFEKWKQSSESGGAEVTRKNMIQDAILFGILVVPVSLLHHLLRGAVGFVLTAGFFVVMTILLFVKTRHSHQDTSL